MNRVYTYQTFETNDKLTDEMIEQANEIVSENMKYTTEVRERYCRVFGIDPEMFSIECTTPSEYRSYIFTMKDGNI